MDSWYLCDKLVSYIRGLLRLQQTGNLWKCKIHRHICPRGILVDVLLSLLACLPPKQEVQWNRGFLKGWRGKTSVHSVFCYDFSVIGGMEAVYLYKASLSKQVFLDRFLFLSLLSFHLALLWQPTCLFVALLKHRMHQTSPLHMANIFVMPCTLM